MLPAFDGGDYEACLKWNDDNGALLLPTFHRIKRPDGTLSVYLEYPLKVFRVFGSCETAVLGAIVVFPGASDAR